MTTIILATGLLQPRRVSAGMYDAYGAIRKENRDADVRLYKWKERDINYIARLIAVDWKDDSRLVLAGHSFGVWFCCELAKELQAMTVPVRVLLSADGVNRPLGQTLEIPSNVAEVQSWYQTQGKIKGSEIITTPPTVHTIHEQVHVGHARVDETPAFQAAVLEFATGGKQ